MPLLILALGVLALLVWLGQGSRASKRYLNLARAALAVGAAAGAVIVGLRGLWPLSVALAVASAWLGRGVKTTNLVPQGETMSEAQARAILGVGPGADAAAIEAAWRNMMRRTHPDQGGTDGLAAQVNAARERLRGELR